MTGPKIIRDLRAVALGTVQHAHQGDHSELDTPDVLDGAKALEQPIAPENRMTHHRVTPQGQSMGKSVVRLAELGRQRLEGVWPSGMKVPMLRSEMCKSCACQPGSVPNGCLQTQMDFLKSAAQGKPFLCHAPKDGRACAGWVRVRAELVANPLPLSVVDLLDKWDYSPPEEAAIDAAMKEQA